MAEKLADLEQAVLGELRQSGPSWADPLAEKLKRPRDDIQEADLASI
jgi:hypothetical protein